MKIVFQSIQVNDVPNIQNRKNRDYNEEWEKQNWRSFYSDAAVKSWINYFAISNSNLRANEWCCTEVHGGRCYLWYGVSELNKGCVYSTREGVKLLKICRPNLLHGISLAVTHGELHGINAINVKYQWHLHIRFFQP
jgi:hypothetical protein